MSTCEIPHAHVICDQPAAHVWTGQSGRTYAACETCYARLTRPKPRRTTRMFFRCQKCRKPWAHDVALIDDLNYQSRRADFISKTIHAAACPLCEYVPLRHYPHRFMGEVKGPRLSRAEDRCPCDRRCTNATGPNCECSCGGVNHGSGRLVRVDIDCGPVPQGVTSS